MIRTANAVWNGSGKDGNGTVSTQSTVLNGAQYSYKTRFEDGIGTNPEELIAAAHASCFTMKLSFSIGAAGFTPDTLNTKCEITFVDGVLSKSHLIVVAKVPGISKEQFDAAVKDAEANCPISKLLKLEISSEATLA
ncbi:OsmC family protein [soil metagenome]